MKVKFFAPNGQDEDGVSTEHLENLLLNEGSEFWESGSGDAAVRFTEGKSEGEVILMVREPFGVFVQFTEKGTGKEWVLSTGDSEEETVTIRQNNEPWELPRAFFVDRRVAASTVVEFVKTGKRPDSKSWVEF